MKNIRKLFICGIIASPHFVITFLLEGITRAGYNPFRDPISSLSIGQYGGMQIVNFVIIGIPFLLYAYGLRLKLKKSSRNSFWGPLLIGLAGMGFIGAGIFVIDPFIGYPTDIPYKLIPQTTHGLLHNFFSGFVFYGLPASTFVFTRYFSKIGNRSWSLYSLLSGVGSLIFFIITSVFTFISISSNSTAAQ